MSRPLFLPSLRQAAWLAAIALASIVYALYLRYQVIEQSTVGIACEAGPANWLCTSRRTAILLFTPSVFGAVAIGAALLNLVRPSLVLCAVALIAGGFGIVLYNVALSALAVGAPDPQPGAARARTRLSATAASAAQHHTACQLGTPSLKTITAADSASTTAAAVSAAGRTPGGRGMSNASSRNGTAALVSGANGKSR